MKQVSTKRSNLHNILKKYLKAYKLQLNQELKRNDHEEYIGRFVNQALERRQAKNDFFSFQQIIFGDEFPFEIDGECKQGELQNIGEEIPREILKIGTYLFQTEAGAVVTVNVTMPRNRWDEYQILFLNINRNIGKQ